MHSFYPDAPLGLLQAVRAVHALMDTELEVCVLPEDADKFEALRERFGARYTVTTRTEPSIPIMVNHAEPWTAIGGLGRPLIFSPSILAYCRSLWPEERLVRFSFAGLVTDARHEVLSRWVRDSFPGARLRLPRQVGGWTDRLRSLVGWSAGPTSTERRIGDVTLWSSTRGRQFPIKSWDDDYYRLLARSQFVLCPNGDHVWSYRFFEAILCGAIPVVQDASRVYEGFRFRRMGETAADLVWSERDAAHNFDRAREVLTVAPDELANAVLSQLALSS